MVGRYSRLIGFVEAIASDASPRTEVPDCHTVMCMRFVQSAV